VAFQISASLATDATDSTASRNWVAIQIQIQIQFQFLKYAKWLGTNLQLARRHLQTARYQAAIMQVRACHCARNCALFQLENVSG